MFSLVPRRFLFVWPLSFGAELIITLGFISHASGIYGILSIFTGHPINAAQVVFNIFALISLPIFFFALRYVKRRNALRMVLFSYFYLINTLFNLAFTIVFAVGWFAEMRREDRKAKSASDPIANPAENVFSIIIMVITLLFKFYFSLIIFAFARQLVRRQDLRADIPLLSWEARIQAFALTIGKWFWFSGMRSSNSGSQQRTRLVDNIDADD